MSKNMVHAQALVETHHIGPNAHVMAFARVGANTDVKRNAVIDSHAYLGDDVQVGVDAVVGPGVFLAGHVVIEEGAVLGPLAAVIETTVRTRKNSGERCARTVIGRGARVGARATLVCGVTVGRSAFVEAGSWVTTDVPGFARVRGTPARQVGWVCACGESLTVGEQGEPIRCACGRAYALADGRLGELEGAK
jgi:UDP-2-acetamido-3-amino-2,3-dideoxy-glucuronate N-acetyltransferase